MSNALFPTLPGLMWGMTLSDVFNTQIYQTALPGSETRISKGPDPTFAIKLEYEFLRNYPGLDELNTLRAFFSARKGQFDSFLLDPTSLTKNPIDSSIAGQVLTVDGNNYASLIRTEGGNPETIYEVNTITNIYANGSPITPGGVPNTVPIAGQWNYWTASGSRTYGSASYPGVVIQFGSSPTLPVTADFSWYYRVRFEKANADFDAFMFELYELQEISLVTTRDL
jgi:hypothetical protein